MNDKYEAAAPTLEDGVDVLAARLPGKVVQPGEADWDAARRAWNLTADQRPAAVVFPESAEDVAEVVDVAREHGLRVTTQGTGHAAHGLGPIDGVILVKTSRMTAVAIDPSARRARVEAGVIWESVVQAAAEHGLAALHGSSPDVGVVGHTLGGGMGWYARSLGLAANSVTAIELVTADGRLVRADSEDEPDLFWALRGGGGNFGVVTAIKFDLYPITEVYGGILFWPLERAAEVLFAWGRWVDSVPDELTSVGRILRFPPIPEIPEPFRGNSFVAVEAVYLGSKEDGRALLRPLRELSPLMDTFAVLPPTALSHLHMDPEHPAPGIGDGIVLSDLPPDAIDAVVGQVGAGASSTLLTVEIRHLEGALAEAKPDSGAIATVDGKFAAFGLGIVAKPELRPAVEADLASLVAALSPWDSGRMYFNFAESRQDGTRLFGEHAHQRLRRIKAHVDPGDLIRANHPIVPVS
jgi:hypothetical protein